MPILLYMQLLIWNRQIDIRHNFPLVNLPLSWFHTVKSLFFLNIRDFPSQSGRPDIFMKNRRGVMKYRT